ncbi:hypothetical protein SAMN05444422_103224 [Halobiforma haloterrestris]|uniref:Uncharacterized protein n=1 Tax=Natronobacterium haloterrestre TaxID=148448 RepID=A0A1I1FCN9_NATHA|nr:hypothetical protein SAMN05444422_103224 [Halobiforma haloterrestris]
MIDTVDGSDAEATTVRVRPIEEGNASQSLEATGTDR